MNQPRVNAAIAELKGMIDGLTQRLLDVSGDLAEERLKNETLTKELEELKKSNEVIKGESNES